MKRGGPLKRTSALTSDSAKRQAFIERGRGGFPLSRAAAPKRTGKCERCGEPLTGRAKRFCSRACLLASIADERRLSPAVCAVCGAEFRPRSSSQRCCSHACGGKQANADRHRLRTGRCTVCGAGIDPGNPSKPRQTCGAATCIAEAKARSMRAQRNPMKDAATAAKASATRMARRRALDSDVPGEPRVKCSRPGCQNVLHGQAGLYCSPRCHYEDRGRTGGRRRAQPYHRCATCREVFAWDGTGKGACCSLACAGKWGGRPAPVDVVETVQLRGYRKADWLAVALGKCSQPGCAARAIHRHHITFEQHVIRAKGDRWDPANALVLCGQHHADLHARRDFPVAALPTPALDFAAALLGPPAAYEYFRRRYTGVEADPRAAPWIAGES